MRWNGGWSLVAGLLRRYAACCLGETTLVPVTQLPALQNRRPVLTSQPYSSTIRKLNFEQVEQPR